MSSIGGSTIIWNSPLWPTFFTQILHPMTPFFHYSHTQWPPLFQNFNVKFKNFRVHLENFVHLQLKKMNFYSNLIYTKWPHILGNSHQKRSNFLGSHTQWPLFSTKSYTECPCFRSPVGTYPSLSYSSAPLPRIVLHCKSQFWPRCSFPFNMFNRNNEYSEIKLLRTFWWHAKTPSLLHFITA